MKIFVDNINFNLLKDLIDKY